MNETNRLMKKDNSLVVTREKGRGKLTQHLIFLEALLHARHCVKDFSCIHSFGLTKKSHK